MVTEHRDHRCLIQRGVVEEQWLQSTESTRVCYSKGGGRVVRRCEGLGRTGMGAACRQQLIQQMLEKATPLAAIMHTATNLMYRDSRTMMAYTQDQATCPPTTHALIQEKIRELEKEISQPERREFAKARRKMLKEVSAFLADKAKSAEEKLIFLEQKIISLVCTPKAWSSLRLISIVTGCCAFTLPCVMSPHIRVLSLELGRV